MLKTLIPSLILSVPLSVGLQNTSFDYETLTTIPTKRDAAFTQRDFLFTLVVNDQTLSEFRSKIESMPKGSTLTREQILSLIEDCTKNMSQKVDKSRIEKELLKNMNTMLDAKKAIKKAEYLEKELNRLRKKKGTSGGRPGGGLGGGVE